MTLTKMQNEDDCEAMMEECVDVSTIITPTLLRSMTSNAIRHSPCLSPSDIISLKSANVSFNPSMTLAYSSYVQQVLRQPESSGAQIMNFLSWAVHNESKSTYVLTVPGRDNDAAQFSIAVKDFCPGSTYSNLCNSVMPLSANCGCNDDSDDEPLKESPEESPKKSPEESPKKSPVKESNDYDNDEDENGDDSEPLHAHMAQLMEEASDRIEELTTENARHLRKIKSMASAKTKVTMSSTEEREIGNLMDEAHDRIVSMTEEIKALKLEAKNNKKGSKQAKKETEIKAVLDEATEHIEHLNRENRKLSREINDLQKANSELKNTLHTLKDHVVVHKQERNHLQSKLDMHERSAAAKMGKSAPSHSDVMSSSADVPNGADTSFFFVDEGKEAKGDPASRLLDMQQMMPEHTIACIGYKNSADQFIVTAAIDGFHAHENRINLGKFSTLSGNVPSYKGESFLGFYEKKGKVYEIKIKH